MKGAGGGATLIGGGGGGGGGAGTGEEGAETASQVSSLFLLNYILS